MMMMMMTNFFPPKKERKRGKNTNVNVIIVEAYPSQSFNKWRFKPNELKRDRWTEVNT